MAHPDLRYPRLPRTAVLVLALPGLETTNSILAPRQEERSVPRSRLGFSDSGILGLDCRIQGPIYSLSGSEGDRRMELGRPEEFGGQGPHLPA
jgi:hypothetical protein